MPVRNNDKKNFYAENEQYIQARFLNSDSNRLVAKLDIELFVIGLGHNIIWWPNQLLHQDPYWRLYLPLKGEFNLLFDGMKFQVKPGKMILVPSCTQFAYEPGTPSTHYYLHFFSKELDKRFHLQYPLALPTETAEKTADFEMLMQLGCKENTDMDFYNYVIIRNKMLELLAPFVDNLLKGQSGQNDQGAFSKVFTAIENMLPGEVDIRQLAKLAGMNRAQFSASFRNTFGMGPREYSIHRRIAKAKMLLLMSNLSAKEIAVKVGYDNEYYFYRVFRKIAKMTPLEYRKRSQID